MKKGSSAFFGLILVVVGLFFLLPQLFPSMEGMLHLGRNWPYLLVGLGGLFILAGLAATPPLAIPGSIIAGIGGILAYQNASGDWASWAFAWALIPGFVGVGMILMGLRSRELRHALRQGGTLLLTSLIMFFIFGAFFQGMGDVGRYWPAVLIVAGVWMLVKERAGKR